MLHKIAVLPYDIWTYTDEDLCLVIRKQWKEKLCETRGYKNAVLLDWFEILYSLKLYNSNKNICLFPSSKWDESLRTRLKAEIDTFFVKLYSLTEKELCYILIFKIYLMKAPLVEFSEF